MKLGNGEELIKSYDYCETKKGKRTTKETFILTNRRAVTVHTVQYKKEQLERRDEIRVKDITSVSTQYKHGKGLNKWGLILMIIGIVLFIVSIPVLMAGNAMSDSSMMEDAGESGVGAGVIVLILGLALISLGIWIMIKFGKISRDFYLILTGSANIYEPSCELTASTGAIIAKPKKRKGLIAKLIKLFTGNKKLKVHIDEDLVMDMMDEVGSTIWELQAKA